MFGSFDLLSNMTSTLCINTNIFVYKNIVQNYSTELYIILYNELIYINILYDCIILVYY